MSERGTNGGAADRRRIGRAIARERAARHVPQRVLAEAAGLPQSTVSRIENGRYGVSAGNLQRFADALGCDVADLYGGAS